MQILSTFSPCQLPILLFVHKQYYLFSSLAETEGRITRRAASRCCFLTSNLPDWSPGACTFIHNWDCSHRKIKMNYESTPKNTHLNQIPSETKQILHRNCECLCVCARACTLNPHELKDTHTTETTEWLHSSKGKWKSEQSPVQDLRDLSRGSLWERTWQPLASEMLGLHRWSPAL